MCITRAHGHLATSDGVNLSGTGRVGAGFQRAVRIANGGGADIELNDLSVVMSSSIITQQPTPASQTLPPGQTATISVEVAGKYAADQFMARAEQRRLCPNAKWNGCQWFHCFRCDYDKSYHQRFDIAGWHKLRIHRKQRQWEARPAACGIW